jgi:undecaprenyl-diphosphatase
MMSIHASMVKDYLANFFLFFSHITLILPLMILGFLKVSRRIFFQASCLCALDLVVNVALKGTFKIPLSPTLHKIGYAFPSGHMQLSVVFYGWLASRFLFWPFRVIVMMVLLGIAFGLIHYDYHNVFDVVGGVFFGLALLCAFQYSLRHATIYTPWAWMIFASSLMLYNATQYAIIPVHAWHAYGALLGFIGLERCISRNGRHFSGWTLVN